MKIKLFALLFFIAASLVTANCQTVTVANIIGNNMVLQQNTKIPLWGWAAASTVVEIEASWGQSASTVADSDGKWKAEIQTPVAISGQAPQYTITFKGPANTITFTNILVGEVWFCTGQSNMWMPMSYYSSSMPGVVNYQAEVAAANYPNIRLFTVPLTTSSTVLSNTTGSWTSCNPTTVASFSAVAYYFGKELFNNPSVNVPIGLINDSYGGSSIQAWMKKEVLLSDPDFKTHYLDATYTSLPTTPSQLYNGMIAPVIPYAIKGMLWYQGESNMSNGSLYTKANIAMINDWRASWGYDFSFYAVQLTPRYYYTPELTDIGYVKAQFREAQSNIQTLPGTGIVVTSDLLVNSNELSSVHPRNKKDIGIRLSLWALANDYGQKKQYLGPLYKDYKLKGSSVLISFTKESLGGGLTSKDGKAISNFRMAGADKKFYPAIAEIKGDTIIVSSSYVNFPEAVRYAYTDGAMTNLQNREGIAAFPFRTDSWTTFSYFNLLDSTVVLQKSLINHDFEVWTKYVDGTPNGASATCPDGWLSVYASGSNAKALFKRSDDTPIGVGNSWQIKQGGTKGGFGAYQNIWAPNGTFFDNNKKYRLSISAKQISGDGSDAKVYCQWIANDGTTDITPAGDAGNKGGLQKYLTINSNSWTTYSFDCTPPIGAAKFIFKFFTMAGAEVIWDDASFDEIIKTGFNNVNDEIKIFVDNESLKFENVDFGTQMVIYSSIGKIVHKDIVSTTSYKLGSLNKGVYIVKLGKFITKIVL